MAVWGQSKDNSFHVLTASLADGNSVLDGFTVYGGNDNRDSEVTGNREFVPTGYSAGLLAISGNLTITSCEFYRNSGGKGGAVYCEDAVVRLVDCRFRENCAADGGGVHYASVQMYMNDCIFIDNEAMIYGGGIHGQESELEIVSCRFTHNRAEHGGSGLWLEQSNVKVFNCILSGNVGSVVISSLRNTLRLMNCTFHGNVRAGEPAPSLAGYPAVDVEITNCIFGTGEALYASPDSMVPVSYSNIEGGMSRIQNRDPNGGVIWGLGNIDVDPCFVAPGYWEDPCNTATSHDDIWHDGDYHLKSQAGHWNPNTQTWVQDDVTSPCIDAGDPNSPIELEPFPNGGRINMGVNGGTVQASKSYFGEPPCDTIIAGDINGDCRVDFEDLKILVDHWLE